jgi:hypothetical protein
MKQILFTATGKKNYTGSFFSLSFFCLLIIAFSFISCKKTSVEKPQPEPSYHLNLSTTSIQSPGASGNASTVSVEANAEWKVTIPAGIDWIEVNKTGGNGNYEIQIRIIK